MKKFIAILLISTLGFAVSLSCSASVHTEKSQTSHVEKFDGSFQMVYINDALSPVVLPQYDRPVMIYSSSDLFSGTLSKITASSNSPPRLCIRGDTN